MLSEAKHLGYRLKYPKKGSETESWPSGLRPLRCRFASLRMTAKNL
jgi:hypothetical protein